jgi:Flp pilus assembly protein TadD
MKAYNENDYKNAARILSNATQESPNDWSLWFFLGVSYYLDKQAKPSINALLQADDLNKYALEIEIKWYLAQAYLLNNDPQSALPYLLWLKEKPGDYSSKADALLEAIQDIDNNIQ